MSDAEINIAIAEWCGKVCPMCNNTGVMNKFGQKDYAQIRSSQQKWVNEWPENEPDIKCNHTGQILNYCRDLNAIHEAEKKMDPIKAARYTSEIWSAMCRTNAPEQLLGTIHATARQRAEALLRTLGLWKE